jgi:hypothetical protein
MIIGHLSPSCVYKVTDISTSAPDVASSPKCINAPEYSNITFMFQLYLLSLFMVIGSHVLSCYLAM